MDYIELGSCPVNETCISVSNDDYMPAMRAECKRYKTMLEKRFPDIPSEAYFKIGTNQHDFGTYLDVRIIFNENNEEASDFAYFVEDNLPTEWNDDSVIRWHLTQKELWNV